ncbi:MAG: RNA-binding S4 domain-containing protein [Bacteroidota bacterium]|nr:RNA-binding S4 domain-containing protein [Bacteroidota bacterium]
MLNNSVITFRLKEGDEYIELIKLLKVTNVAESGAMAKIMVSNGEVRRNGSTELRKRAKIRAGEIISTLGYEIRVN